MSEGHHTPEHTHVPHHIVHINAGGTAIQAATTSYDVVFHNQPDPKVHARFRLNKVTRGQGYFKEPGSAEEPRSIEAAHVLLDAVHGEPFGAYTPSGKLDMFIVNPAASQMFFDASIGQEFDILISPVHKSK